MWLHNNSNIPSYFGKLKDDPLCRTHKFAKNEAFFEKLKDFFGKGVGIGEKAVPLHLL